MNITQIKTAIGQPVLTMVRQLELKANPNDKDVPTKWVSHWDNINRIRVSMHEDVFNQIKADPNFGGLAVKPPVVHTPEGKQPYTMYVVITPKNIEATF